VLRDSRAGKGSPATLFAALCGGSFHEVHGVGFDRVEGGEVGGYEEEAGVIGELGGDAL